MINGDQDITVARYLNDLVLGTVDYHLDKGTAFVYPNPVHQVAMLSYTLDKETLVSISLIDQHGHYLKSYLNNTYMTPGTHVQPISLPELLPAGLYLIAISSPAGTVTITVFK
jgi:hypothetical protein